VALEASLTAMKGDGWTTESLKSIKDAISTLNNVDSSGVWSYATRTLSDYSGVWSVGSRALTDKSGFSLASTEYDKYA
jgi:hypothetical protein